MAKSAVKYPSLHNIRCIDVLLVSVAEGKGTPDDPVREITYVCEASDETEYKVIGELYDSYSLLKEEEYAG